MVNDYLLQKLFVDTQKDSVYEKWFAKIWGCPELFESFLKLASTQSQKTVAQDIVRQMSSLSSFTIPQSVFANLVEVEHQGDDWGWINQDHAVHSVNVYICGIYLFFFYQPLKQQLLRYFLKLGGKSQHEAPIDEAISTAIQCIRIAALYHDVGYVLERTVNPKGYFDAKSGMPLDDLMAYEMFEQEVLYEIAKKAISRVLFAQAMIGQSRDKLTNELVKNNWIQDGTQWMQLQLGVSMRGDEVKAALNSMADTVELKYISSWEGMKYLIPYLSCEDVLVIVKDSELRPVAICHGLHSNPMVYYRKNLQMDREMLSHIGELKPIELNKYGVTLTYYIRNTDVPLPRELHHLKESIVQISRHCRNRFSSNFELLFDEDTIPQLLYKISEWIERKVPLDCLCGATSKHRTHQKEIDNQLITRLYHERAAKVLNGQKMEVLDPESQVEKLGEAFLEEIQKTEFLSDLYQAYNRISNTDPDTTCDDQLRECVVIVYGTLQEIVKLGKQRNPVIEVNKGGKSKDRKVTFRGLDKNRFNGIVSVEQLFQRLEHNLSALGLKWEDIESYKPYHNFYDHGKVSAGLLIEGYGIYSSVMEKMGDSAFFRCVWQTPEDMQALNKKYELSTEIVEAIFAVLMHNIWVNSDSNPSGLKFIHDLSVNAMSYYLAFCDTLQFWDRDKLFDPAKQRQPEATYYGKDFDIGIDKNRIIVRCRTDGVKDRLSSKLRGMDDFLKDANSMLKVVECL